MATTRTAVATDYGRIAGMFGIITGVLVVLAIVITFAGGAPPALDDPAQKVINYYQNNEGLAKLGGIIGFLILGTAPIWFLGVYSALRDRGTAASDAWPRLGLTAFIVTGAFAGTQGAVALSIALGAKDEFQGAPPVAGALFDIYNGLGAAIAIAFGLYFLATGVALARAGGYPAWWSQMLYVAAVASFISFLAPFTEIDVLALLGLIPFIIFGIFAAASGMAMQRGYATAPRNPAL